VSTNLDSIEAEAWRMLRKLEGEDFKVALALPDILEKLSAVTIGFSEFEPAQAKPILERIAQLQARIAIAKASH
jgi:hypothetical protein